MGSTGKGNDPDTICALWYSHVDPVKGSLAFKLKTLSSPRLMCDGLQKGRKKPIALPLCECVGVCKDDVTIYLKDGPVEEQWSGVIKPTHKNRKLWFIFRDGPEVDQTSSVKRRMALIMSCYKWTDLTAWKSFESYRGDGWYRQPLDAQKFLSGFTPGADLLCPELDVGAPDLLCPELGANG